MARIRANSVAGRYDAAIAAMRDTSSMVTRPVEVKPAAQATLPGK